MLPCLMGVMVSEAGGQVPSLGQLLRALLLGLRRRSWSLTTGQTWVWVLAPTIASERPSQGLRSLLWGTNAPEQVLGPSLA